MKEALIKRIVSCILCIFVLIILICKYKTADKKEAEVTSIKTQIKNIDCGDILTDILTDRISPIIRVKDTMFIEGDQVYINDLAEAIDPSGIDTFRQTSGNSQWRGLVIIHADTPISLEAVDNYGNHTEKEFFPNVTVNGEEPQRARYIADLAYYPYEEINYIDDDVYALLKEEYSQIDWSSEFERGNPDTFDFYREQFKKLVTNQRPFLDTETGERVYLKDYLHWDDSLYSQAGEGLSYYYFDMDSDGEWELCITDVSFILIFKYNRESDCFFLWKDYWSSYYEILGTRTVNYYNPCIANETSGQFYKLNKEGNINHGMFFEIQYIWINENETETVYMIALPQYTDKDQQIEITKEMKQQGYLYGQYYTFIVTEEQFHDLIREYELTVQKADQERKEVTYTYEELFGK